MEIIYLLVPLSLVLIGVIIWAFFWAVRSGQFDDLEGPAHRILMDDDSIEAGRETEKNDKGKEEP
jgi:cbb3-type cytochrome oxidase maturation protein